MAVEGINEFTEFCDECRSDTPHEVTIELVENEETVPETAKYSRDPYRTTTCLSCGHSTSQLANSG